MTFEAGEMSASSKRGSKDVTFVHEAVLKVDGRLLVLLPVSILQDHERSALTENNWKICTKCKNVLLEGIRD